MIHPATAKERRPPSGLEKSENLKPTLVEEPRWMDGGPGAALRPRIPTYCFNYFLLEAMSQPPGLCCLFPRLRPSPGMWARGFPNLAKELTQMYGALRSVNPLPGTDRWFILRFLHSRSTHSTAADIGLSRNPARRFCRKLRIA